MLVERLINENKKVEGWTLDKLLVLKLKQYKCPASLSEGEGMRVR